MAEGSQGGLAVGAVSSSPSQGWGQHPQSTNTFAHTRSGATELPQGAAQGRLPTGGYTPASAGTSHQGFYPKAGHPVGASTAGWHPGSDGAGDPEDPTGGWDGGGLGAEDVEYEDDEYESDDEEYDDDFDVSRLGFDARSHATADTDADAAEGRLNAIGRCFRHMSGCRCTYSAVFALVWTILQLALLIPTLVPATVLVVLFGLLYRGPEIIFKAYIAMSITKRIGCNVRVLLFALFPIAFLVLIMLGPALAGVAMLGWVVTRTYIVNSTDVVQVQRTSILHTLSLLFAGVVAPCSDFLKQSTAFLLAISHGVFEGLQWLGDQRPNRSRVWPEPFEIRIDWFLISVALSFVYAPIQGAVFLVMGAIAYVPGIVTSVRRVYTDPEHFGLSLPEIQASPGRAVLAFFALLLLPVTYGLGLVALPFVGIALGVKSAFVAFWTTQIGWNGGTILWNDFGGARFALPPKRRDSFTVWQEEQARMANEAAASAAEEMEEAAARARGQGGDGDDATEGDEDADAARGSPGLRTRGDEDPSAAPDSKELDGDPTAPGGGGGGGSAGPLRSERLGVRGRVTTGRSLNVKDGGAVTVVVPIDPGLPRSANCVKTRAVLGVSSTAAPTAPHLSARRKANTLGFDYAIEPVVVPGHAAGGLGHRSAFPGRRGTPTATAVAAEAGAEPAGAVETVKVSESAAVRPPLPRGCAASWVDLRDDQTFLAKVMAVTILDVPFDDSLPFLCAGCGSPAAQEHPWHVIAQAILAGVVSGLFGVVAMPLFGVLWAVVTFVPCFVRIVVSYINPTLYPEYPDEQDATSWGILHYYLGKWPLYVLVVIITPVPMLVLLCFYVLYCVVEGARVGPITAANSLDDDPLVRALKALGRTMRSHDHNVFRFTHDRVGTSEVPFTLIGYSCSLLCDDVDGPSAAEQSFLDELAAHNLHHTTARQRFQGGMATKDGPMRRFNPAAIGQSALDMTPFAASFYAPQAQPKVGTPPPTPGAVATDAPVPPRPAATSAEPDAVPSPPADSKPPRTGDAGRPSSGGEEPPSSDDTSKDKDARPPIPASRPCCPCCDPEAWEQSLNVREAPTVTQVTYDARKRREEAEEAQRRERQRAVEEAARAREAEASTRGAQDSGEAVPEEASPGEGSRAHEHDGPHADDDDTTSASQEGAADDDRAARSDGLPQHESATEGSAAAPQGSGDQAALAAIVGGDDDDDNESYDSQSSDEHEEDSTEDEDDAQGWKAPEDDAAASASEPEAPAHQAGAGSGVPSPGQPQDRSAGQASTGWAEADAASDADDDDVEIEVDDDSGAVDGDDHEDDDDDDIEVEDDDDDEGQGAPLSDAALPVQVAAVDAVRGQDGMSAKEMDDASARFAAARKQTKAGSMLQRLKAKRAARAAAASKSTEGDEQPASGH